MVHSFVLIWASHFLWFWFFYLFICFNHFLAACARSQNMKSLWSSKIPSNKNFQITSCVQHSVSRMTWAKADKGDGDGALEPWASHCDWAFTPPTTHAHTHTHTPTHFRTKKWIGYWPQMTLSKRRIGEKVSKGQPVSWGLCVEEGWGSCFSRLLLYGLPLWILSIPWLNC